MLDLNQFAINLILNQSVHKVLLAEVPDHLGLNLHGVHVFGLIVVVKGVATLDIDKLVVLSGISSELGHLIKAANVATEQTAPKSILLELVFHFNLLVVFVSSDANLLEEVVCHAAIITMAEFLGALVVSAEWAGLR